MIARIRTFAVALLATVVAFIRVNASAITAAIVDRVPVSVDRTISGLEKVVSKLNRAEAQQRAAAAFEVQVQNASYDREDAANAAAARAIRVRDRVQALIA